MNLAFAISFEAAYSDARRGAIENKSHKIDEDLNVRVVVFSSSLFPDVMFSDYENLLNQNFNDM